MNYSEMLRGIPTTESRVFELEARFGKINFQRNKPYHFQPKVSKEFFDLCLAKLDQFQEWYAVAEWTLEHDFMWYDAEGELVRSRVAFPPNPNTPSSDSQLPEVEHVRKRKRLVQDFKHSFAHTNLNEFDDTTWDIRIALSVEEKVDPDSLPGTVKPCLVRIKNRKSYTYSSTGFDDPCWRFDLSIAWQAETKTKAEEKMKNEPGFFEIECELVNPVAYLNAEHHDDLYVATSMLLKIRDLLGSDRRYILDPFQIRRGMGET